MNNLMCSLLIGLVRLLRRVFVFVSCILWDHQLPFEGLGDCAKKLRRPRLLSGGSMKLAGDIVLLLFL